MPAFALSERPATVSRFDVVGEYSATVDRFVRHVALYTAEAGEVRRDEEVEVVHMGPPLERAGRAKAHALGSVPLTIEEIREIEAWIAEVEDEYAHSAVRPSQQYQIHPPWTDKSDPNTGVRRYRRYSCAGFVLDSYRQVDIYLLIIDDQEWPEVDEQVLRAAYPELSDRRLLGRWGLQGDPPWRILLAGHVRHALDRPGDQIRQQPYHAAPGDERF